MKKYIKPETLTVKIQNATPLMGASTVTNQKSDATQLSREARFSSWDSDNDEE